MTRRRKEFPRSVRVAVIKRSTDPIGNVRCEECQSICKRFEIDHVNPDALTGEPTLANAKLLCEPCHDAKTKRDVGVIAKAKRVEAKHLGAKAPSARPIPNRPFPKSPCRDRHPTAMPARRAMFVEVP